jgi:deoxyribonuclease V
MRLKRSKPGRAIGNVGGGRFAEVIGHGWRLTPSQAREVQLELAKRVRVVRVAGWRMRWVAGLDASFSRDGRWCIGGVVLWDVETSRVLEKHVAVRRVWFPYVPGFLSFREGPALLAALRKLRRVPDVLMCDGQGLAHPRRFGVACHMGVICDMPSVGCAKSRLMGSHGEPGMERGGWVPLMDEDEMVGIVLRSRLGVRPLYVSVGHRMDLRCARELVMRCGMGYRMPEPTRLADRMVGEVRSCE